MTNNALLVLNVGSSTLKACVFEASRELGILGRGQIAGIGASNELFWNGSPIPEFPTDLDHAGAIQEFLAWFQSRDESWTLEAVGHRIVHGGPLFAGPTCLTSEVLRELEAFIPLAPRHQPMGLAAVKAVAKSHPGLTQIGCFDTAFHKDHAPVFQHYAIPKILHEQGIRRYGFHGLSYEWIVHELKLMHPQAAEGRVVAAHLGNGASLCAIRAGVSVDTTMGMTTLDGLPMGTRCGSIDPGAILYMLRVLELHDDQIEHILACDSGLKGLSGTSRDVRDLLASRSADADFALHYFCTMAAQHIARMAVAIGGIDALVFTGGMGENVETVRLAISEQLRFLMPFEVLVIPANEERMIAEHCWALLAGEVVL